MDAAATATGAATGRAAGAAAEDFGEVIGVPVAEAVGMGKTQVELVLGGLELGTELSAGTVFKRVSVVLTEALDTRRPSPSSVASTLRHLEYSEVGALPLLVLTDRTEPWRGSPGVGVRSNAGPRWLPATSWLDDTGAPTGAAADWPRLLERLP
mmetsp:Transcript_75752/g.139523  ORF Transcript_75752/g.139523 Transcript_75752/m.139523 type:complete len:154 (-) Transcript_75752:233-694(-)